ncbi:activating transcription factor 7-interacting protein 1-like [Osmerus mordax]|uniref:activating transcription factor 7-interacting protein 1-like n=1 Tax=Osmerus mordax TaxID=8014 RepID=UPI003510C7EA
MAELRDGAVCQDNTTDQPSSTVAAGDPSFNSTDADAPGDATTADPAGTLADAPTDATTADPAVNSTVDHTGEPDDSNTASGDPTTAESLAADTTTALAGLAVGMGPSTGPPANTNALGHPAVVDATSSASVDTLPFTIGSSVKTIAGFGIRVIAVTDAPMMPSATEPEASPVRPVVVCVTEEALKDKDAVQVHLQRSSSCEESKSVLEKLLAPWCASPPCQLDVFQEESTKNLLVTSPHAGLMTLKKALNMVEVKEALGASQVEAHPVKSSSAVFVSVLMAGLLLAAGLIGAYCLRIRRGHNTKGMRLAEETYPGDEENQGNTLVSMAPLTPPESQEKPAINGEAPEADKTQPPPTNGHSTKTADTEL